MFRRTVFALFAYSCLPVLACPSEKFMSVAEEAHAAHSVVVGAASREEYSAEGPGHGWVDGTFYTIRVAETVLGQHSRTVRVFSENSSGRFPLEIGVTYLLFVSRCDGQLYIDAHGNSGPLPRQNDALREVRSLAPRKPKNAA